MKDARACALAIIGRLETMLESYDKYIPVRDPDEMAITPPYRTEYHELEDAVMAVLETDGAASIVMAAIKGYLESGGQRILSENGTAAGEFAAFIKSRIGDI